MSKCLACGVEKPLNGFYSKPAANGKRYRCHTCKQCHIKQVKRDTYARAHPKPKFVRLPSIECAFKCPTCLMAYPMNGNVPFASQDEADKCCKRMEA